MQNSFQSKKVYLNFNAATIFSCIVTFVALVVLWFTLL